MFAIAQLNTNGTLDTTFNSTGIDDLGLQRRWLRRRLTTANDVVVQPDSKIVVVGSAELPRVVRLPACRAIPPWRGSMPTARSTRRSTAPAS